MLAVGWIRKLESRPMVLMVYVLAGSVGLLASRVPLPASREQADSDVAIQVSNL